MDEEIWKDIRGYEGYYQVSTYGNIRSLDRVVTSKLGIPKTVKGRMKKQTIDEHGYCTVSLYKDNVGEILSVHRVVLDAFDKQYIKHPPRVKQHLQVNHKDCDTSNNHLDNLEYVTGIENIRYGYENNRDANIRPTEFYKRIGSHSKRVECLVDGNVFDSPQSAADYYKISVNVVYNRCRDHKLVDGFQFEYIDSQTLGHSHKFVNPSDPGSHKPRAVRCIETGETFPSRIQAAKCLGISTSSIVDSLRDGKRHAGYTFVEPDEILL